MAQHGTQVVSVTMFVCLFVCWSLHPRNILGHIGLGSLF